MKRTTITMDGNGILSLGRHGEESIESDYTVYFRDRYAQLPGYNPLHLFRKIPHNMLCFMEDIDKFTGIVPVAVADLLYFSGDITRQFYIWHDFPVLDRFVEIVRMEQMFSRPAQRLAQKLAVQLPDIRILM